MAMVVTLLAASRELYEGDICWMGFLISTDFYRRPPIDFYAAVEASLSERAFGGW